MDFILLTPGLNALSNLMHHSTFGRNKCETSEMSAIDFYVRFRAILSRSDYSDIHHLSGFNCATMYGYVIQGDITTGIELCGKYSDVYKFIQQDFASRLQVNECSHSHLVHLLLPQAFCELLIMNDGIGLHEFALTTHCHIVLEPEPLPFSDEHIIEIYGHHCWPFVIGFEALSSCSTVLSDCVDRRTDHHRYLFGQPLGSRD